MTLRTTRKGRLRVKTDSIKPLTRLAHSGHHTKGTTVWREICNMCGADAAAGRHRRPFGKADPLTTSGSRALPGLTERALLLLERPRHLIAQRPHQIGDGVRLPVRTKASTGMPATSLSPPSLRASASETHILTA